MSASFESLFDSVQQRIGKGKKTEVGLQKETPKNVSTFDSLFSKEEGVKKPQRSTYEDIQNLPDYLARGGQTVVRSTPRTITGLLKHGSKFLADKGRDQAKKEGREIAPSSEKFTRGVERAFAYPEELLEKLGFETYGEAKKSLEQKSGADKFEQNPLEKGAVTAGEWLGSATMAPATTFGSASGMGTALLGSTAAGVASGAGADETTQLIAGLSVPGALKLTKMIQKGSLTPTGKELEALYQFGKSKGMSEAELAPILQSGRKRGLLGLFASKSKRGAEAIERSESGLGRIYEGLKEESSKLRPASVQEEKKLFEAFEKIQNNLRKSKMPTASKEEAIKRIDEMINNIAANGIKPDEIIDTWIDINKNIRKTGVKELHALKEPLEDLFFNLAPKQKDAFLKTQKMWGSLQKTADKIEPTDVEKLLKLGEVGAMAKGVYDFVTTGDSKLLRGLAITKAGRHAATELLINPRLNNLTGKLLIAIKTGKEQYVVKAVQEIEKSFEKED